MKPIALTSVVLFFLSGSAFGQLSISAQASLTDSYCAGCHNDKLKSGGFSWKSVSLAHPEQSAEQVERVIRKVRAGMMPPAGMPRPAGATMSAFTDSLGRALDRAAAEHPYPGRPPLHRLNRTEYANAIRDLLALNVDVTTLLPADPMSRGFNNMADVLTTSPALMDAYLRAASKISRLALGDPELSAAVATYQLPKELSQLHP
jgi:cytochrome c551/c552